MRLIILLDNKINKINIDSNDIIIVQDYNYYLELSMRYKVYLVDFTKSYESMELKNSIDLVFSKFDKEVQSIKNYTYLKLFCPIHSIINQIECILIKYNINQIILIDGSEHAFLSFIHAEGEGVKKIYRSRWLLNFIIYQYFKNRVDIKWISKHNKTIYYILNIIRETYYLNRMILVRLIKSIIHRYKINKIDLYDKETAIIVANYSLQYRHLLKLIDDKYENVVCIIPKKFNTIKNEKVIIRGNISFKNTLKLIKKSSIKLPKRYKEIEFKVNDKNIKLNSKIFIKSLRMGYLKFLFDCEQIDIALNSIKSNKRIIITDMTFGIDINAVHTISKKNKIKHLNYQYVAMFPMLVPNLDLADEYYIYSSNTFEMYRQYSQNFKLYLPIKSKFKDNYLQNKSRLNITVFTQPDKYTDMYIVLLNELINKIYKNKDSNIKLNIKLHYRQDKKELFTKISEKNDNVNIVDSDIDVEEVIKNTDLVISMTSSVIFEALMLGKISIIYNCNEQDKNLIYNGGNLFPKINFVVEKVDEIIDIIFNYDKYIKEFKYRYNKYLENNNLY